MSVRAVIVEAYPFSRIGLLWAEDGRWIALTRHAKGSEAIALQEGTWLTCEVAADGKGVTLVHPCDRPSDVSAPPEQELRNLRAALARRLGNALRGAPTVHLARPVAEAPVVHLARWQICELAISGARHAWGRDLREREGRVSTLLAEFDPTTASLRSASGRRYELVGPPGFDADGEYVLHVTLHGQGLVASDALSVTDEIWQSIQFARSAPPAR